MSTDKYITRTRFASIFDMERQMRFVVDYMIANRAVIAGPTDLVDIFSTKAMLSTPMSMLFDRCVSTAYIEEFATILRIPDAKSIPDILTMTSVVVDLKQSKYGEPLKPFPEMYQKLVMNISSLVKMTNSGWYVAAIQELHSMYVKGMLSRSYSVAKNLWLSPAHLQFIIRTYSMLVATTIARNTGLNYNELLTVAMIFALYMCQMSYTTKDRFEAVPQVFYNQTYLGQRSDLLSFTDEYQDIIKQGLSLDACCELVGTTGPARLKKYNAELLYRQCSSLGSYIDTLTTRIALEYPPYWVWMMVQAVSGAKLGSFSKILQQHNLLNGAKKFANELVHSAALYENR